MAFVHLPGEHEPMTRQIPASQTAVGPPVNPGRQAALQLVPLTAGWLQLKAVAFSTVCGCDGHAPAELDGRGRQHWIVDSYLQTLTHLSHGGGVHGSVFLKDIQSAAGFKKTCTCKIELCTCKFDLEYLAMKSAGPHLDSRYVSDA